MQGSFSRRLILIALVAIVSGCHGTTTTPTVTPTPPTTTTQTETFTGNLNLNGAATYTFTAGSAGTVTATLTSLGPDSSLTVGIGLGTWNGTACAVTPGIWNDNATQSAVVVGTVSAASLLCVRIADVSAKVSDPLAYTITVVHP